MKHLLLAIATLALISVTMRFMSFTLASEAKKVPTPQIQASPPPEDSKPDKPSAPEPTPVNHGRPPKPGPIICNFNLPESSYDKVGPYRSLEELRYEISHRELWIRNILADPVARKGHSFGVRISFKTPSPFARLGLRSGDILLSLNNVTTRQVEDFPAFLDELESASSLHFRLERKGKLLPLDIQLH